MDADNVTTTQVPRGGTFFEGRAVPGTSGSFEVHPLEGTTRLFPDSLPNTTGSSVRILRSGRKVKAVLVRNDSGVTLLPKRAVTWKAGQLGKRVGGYSRLTATMIAGIVDDQLPSSGVRDGDLFWLIVEGPCVVVTPDAGSDFGVDITEGAALYSLTSTTANATASTTSAATVAAGRLRAWAGTFSAAETTDGSAGNILLNRVGRAMSARTTGNTRADLLVDLNLA